MREKKDDTTKAVRSQMLMKLGGKYNYKFNELAQFPKMLLVIQLFLSLLLAHKLI